MSALFKFSEVEAKTAKPLVVNDIIRNNLRANDDACYSEMERYLLAPGVSGSRAFDQAYAVGVLLKHDGDNGGHLSHVMESTGMSRRMVWDRLQKILRSAGFKMQHGRLMGLLEDKSDENGEDGQPDVD